MSELREKNRHPSDRTPVVNYKNVLPFSEAIVYRKCLKKYGTVEICTTLWRINQKLGFIHQDLMKAQQLWTWWKLNRDSRIGPASQRHLLQLRANSKSCNFVQLRVLFPNEERAENSWKEAGEESWEDALWIGSATRSIMRLPPEIHNVPPLPVGSADGHNFWESLRKNNSKAIN